MKEMALACIDGAVDEFTAQINPEYCTENECSIVAYAIYKGILRDGLQSFSWDQLGGR